MLLIDNVDSFTFNVADLLHRVLGRPPVVWRHDHPAQIDDLEQFGAIVIGPGPGRPQRPADLGISALALEQQQVPVLGVCLGHQGLAHRVGHHVRELRSPMHGRVSQIEHLGTDIFEGIPSPFSVVRYHSLEVVLPTEGPAGGLTATAWASDDGAVMGLAEPGAQRWGVQFHPESVLSTHGDRLVRNFLGLAGIRPQPRPLPDRGPVAEGDTPVGHAAVRSSATELSIDADADADADGAVAADAATDDARAATPPAGVRVQTLALAGPVDAWALHSQVNDGAAEAIWLDGSAGDRERTGPDSPSRFSVIGAPGGPYAHRLTHRVGEGTTEHRPDGSSVRYAGPLIDTVRRLLSRYTPVHDVDLPSDIRPGYVGCLGYGLAAETVGPGTAAPMPGQSDAWLLFVDRMVLLDHHTEQVHLVWLSDPDCHQQQQDWARRAAAMVAAARPVAGDSRSRQDWTSPPAAGMATVETSLRHSRAEYLRLIDLCVDRIRAGESYEICLTSMVSWPHHVAQHPAYRQLRAAGPVPFGAWLRGPDLSILAASPERFLSVSADGHVQARPIKGTRPRHSDPQADAAAAEELGGSVKDRAENLMIVDLVRNDLHRVCASGTVAVPQLCGVESYAAVHQLVSTVTGRLAAGMDALDALASCFPGGSMTGAPKVRTMQILESAEGGPRGFYAGALGWIGVNGALDLAIVIRSATWVQGRVQFGVGGAITVLSDPAEEYQEILHKARTMAAALTAAGHDDPDR